MGITATQNLHFTDGTDAVEDHSTNIEVLARQLDARLRSHDLDTDRFGEDKPFCVLDITVPQILTVASGLSVGAIVFDTIRVDTAGMADLDALPQAMSMRSPGYYQVGFYINSSGTGCVAGSGAALWQANQSAISPYPTMALYGSAHSQIVDFANGWPAGGAASILARSDDATETWGWMNVLVTGTSCPATITINYARLWAYKVRDL